MKIMQLRGEFSDNGPGSQTLAIGIELRKRGHDVIFCASGGKLKEKINESGFDLIQIEELSLDKRNFFNVLKAIIKLSRIISTEKVEVVHAHNAASVFIANIASILFCRKVRFYQSVRGIEVRRDHQWRNWIYRVIRVNKYFAVSQFTKNILTSFGVSENKIVITYNGPDLDRFDIAKKDKYKREIREEFNIPDRAMVIGIVGRQDGNKGHRFLIKAFSQLYDKYPDLFIVLVGEGSEMEENIKFTRELNIEDRTIFTGLRFDVEKLHAAFDIFALLSKKGLEMFPNVILEAMSYGNTFVATNTTGVPETAASGEGFICECEDLNCYVDKFILLLSDDELRKSMGEKARRSVEQKFNIIKVVDKIEEAYRDRKVLH